MTTTIPTLPDRILDDWRSDSPARMLAALRAVGVADGDERLHQWVRCCRQKHNEVYKIVFDPMTNLVNAASVLAWAEACPRKVVV